ncbi:MAG: tetratricopeptide repeat protein [Alphaproteobacteria bacterium]|nr:tetratricopeptide repeat protein [Alphaproteobacteria bacterium]
MEITIEQALQQGVAAHKEGKLQDAERLYRAILQSQPTHPDANHYLGVLAVSADKAEAALPLFKAALETNPETEQFWLSYIDALIKEQQFDNAKQVLEQAKKQGVDTDRLNSLEAHLSPETQEPNAANISPPQELLNNLLRHYQGGRFAEAEKLSAEITQDYPKHPFAWKALGTVLQATGRKSEAAVANQEAVVLSPQDPEAHNNLGNTLIELDRFDEAEASYSQAIALKPNFAEAHNNLGVTLKELGRLEDAVASYTQAITLKPDYADAHNNLGNTLIELDRFDEAEASYTQTVMLKPDYAEAHSNLGISLQELGRLDEAEASYHQALALKPKFAEAHNNLGNTLIKLDRFDEAEASYSQAIALKPDYVEAHYNSAITLRILERFDEAEGRYTQVVALKPDYAEAHNNLGNMLKDLGRLEEAEASYTQAIALQPDYAEAHRNLGVTLKELGRLEDAVASYNHALALNPEYSSVKHLLAALSGETTATAPRDYVEELFDNYAARFESSLVGNLEYKIPKVITEMIIKDCKCEPLGSIMDLGCGSGLLGAEIKPFCGYLEGIDVSGKMLDEAKKKHIYNKLLKQDIVNYLLNESLNFDYFISTDVFIYVGDLSDVFRLIKSRNKTGGKLAFSIETYDGDGFFLEQSGRYSHSKKYIESLCKTFGYKIRHSETQALRKEKNQYISGGLYLLDF